MSLSAQRIYINFVRFVGEEGASLYFNQFLTAGTRRLPQSTLRRLPALRQWKGIASLKERLKRLAECSPGSKVLLGFDMHVYEALDLA